MHPNELEALKPGPGLVLPAITETADAVKRIELARAILSDQRDTVSRRLTEERKMQRLGVDVPALETATWRTFQATALRRFHIIRSEEAAKCIPLCDELLTTEAAGIRAREQGIERGMGKLLGDVQAGADLCALLLRFLGTLPTDHNLNTARNDWRNVAEQSRRALVELPPLPTQQPTASAQTEALRKLIATGKED